MAPVEAVAAVESVKPMAGSEEPTLKPSRAKRADSPAQRSSKPATVDKETSSKQQAEATSCKPTETTGARAAAGKRGSLAVAKKACLIFALALGAVAGVYFASQMRMNYGVHVDTLRSQVVMTPLTGKHLQLGLGAVGLAGLAMLLYRFRSAILCAAGKAASKVKGFVQTAAQKFKRTSKQEATAAPKPKEA
mmetsp:Transcript_48815/g.116054  ORF Transcript_48815/g.116054 Transcript_48815/m.116054 type:complete len:192 (+) Transcript_48815:114-689(+)|eukprot:CAMPEP_0178459132 /NCGR_PEP_ID=MMETSP0689_2-20121128/47946_1 /TAXON_ID=160604 /ORGANISM="Amphidinium massartii, Strain CS-259" /LENGTH=191 /DNA_ID=CAMNT_0020085547 /DNA_START=99 /DNA_END=674 /DNA_ORIENTATION=+